MNLIEKLSHTFLFGLVIVLSSFHQFQLIAHLFKLPKKRRGHWHLLVSSLKFKLRQHFLELFCVIYDCGLSQLKPGAGAPSSPSTCSLVICPRPPHRHKSIEAWAKSSRVQSNHVQIVAMESFPLLFLLSITFNENLCFLLLFISWIIDAFS